MNEKYTDIWISKKPSRKLRILAERVFKDTDSGDEEELDHETIVVPDPLPLIIPEAPVTFDKDKRLMFVWKSLPDVPEGSEQGIDL